jgi:hypothetical protein
MRLRFRKVLVSVFFLLSFRIKKVSFEERRSDEDMRNTLGRLREDMRWFSKDSSVHSRGVEIEGYISLRTVERSGSNSSSSKWKRRYVLLHGTKLYIYKSQKAFEMKPAFPIRARPLDITGYAAGAISVEPPYQLILVPADPNDNRDIWEMRFDTVSEVESWSRVFDKILVKTSVIQNNQGLNSSASAFSAVT